MSSPDLLRWFLPLLLLSLAGCGFQLRGGDLSNLQSVSIAGSNNAPLAARILRSELSVHDIRIVSPAAGIVTVHLLDERTERRSVATSEIFDTAEYELTLELHVSVSKDDEVLLPGETMISERVYAVDRTNLSASYEEQTLLLEEMRSELVARLIRRLDFLSRT